MNTEKYKAENFEQFCKMMTQVAENQLDFHRTQYYPICVSSIVNNTLKSVFYSNIPTTTSCSAMRTLVRQTRRQTHVPMCTDSE